MINTQLVKKCYKSIESQQLHGISRAECYSSSKCDPPKRKSFPKSFLAPPTCYTPIHIFFYSVWLIFKDELLKPIKYAVILNDADPNKQLE